MTFMSWGLKNLVPNLETKNSEVYNFIKSFKILLEGEKIEKCMRELSSIGVSLEVLMKGPI